MASKLSVRRIIFWLLAILLLGWLAWYKISVLDKSKTTALAPSPTGAKAAPMKVKVMVAENRDISNSLFASGTLLPNEMAELRTETSGRITELLFSEGQFVRKGTLLLSINDAELQAQWKKNRFDLDFAKENEQRQKKLLDAQAIGQEEYAAALNRINLLQADGEFIQAQIAKTKLYAPFDGIIGLRSVAPGSFVQTGTVVAPLLQTNPIKLEFALPERYLSRVKKGSEVLFTVDNETKTHSAKINLIDPQIDPDSRNLKVRALSPNSGSALMSGAFARVQLPMREAQQLMVPSEAVVPTAKGKQVFTIKNGQCTPSAITIGLRTENEVQVLTGLAPGDTVILSGLLSVRPGMPVIAE